MDVCVGGTVRAGATSITFTNPRPEPCTITGCKIPGWPPNPPTVPAAQGGTPGKLVIQLAERGPSGTYPYSVSCCPDAHPVIKLE